MTCSRARSRITSTLRKSEKATRCLQQQLANAYFRVGQITSEIGTKKQAMDSFHAALGIWEPLAKANPQVHELAGNVGDCYLAMGKLESLSGDYTAALDELSNSSAVLEPIAKGESAQPRYQASLADCYWQTGIVLANQGKGDESLAIHDQARTIQESLVHRFPESLAYKKSLAENLNAIGFALYARHDLRAALKTI